MISAVIATNNPSALWYLARGSGLVLLGLLTANLVLGVAIQGGWHPLAWPRFAVQTVHRNMALLAVILLAIHVITLELDPFVGVGWWAAVVPFVSPYRSLWVGLGTISLDILTAVVVTSLLRRHLRPTWWRLVHWLAYFSWPIALLHSIGTGSDTHVGAVFVYEIACLGAVVAVVLVRLGRAAQLSPGRRRAGLIAVAALPAAVLLWSATGPLQRGWAQRAGTPTSVLSSTSGSGATPPTPGIPATPLAPFTSSFVGTVQTSHGGGASTLTIQGQAPAGSRSSLLITLQGQLQATGGIAVSTGSAQYAPANSQVTYRGSVVAVSGAVVAMELQSATGSPVRATLILHGGATATQVSGQLYFGTAIPGEG